jgi:RNA polymerase sigma-70 factor, ECF subfamily
VDAPPPANRDPNDGERGTLGALLYADRSRPRVPESAWVALVRAIASGDEVALHAIYQRTHRIVFTLIMRIVHDPQTAEELTLDVFHDVWRRASHYDPAGGTVVGWIMNQARSRALDRHRFDHRKKRVDPHPDAPAEASPLHDSTAALELREQAGRLREALDCLSTHERLAIETTFLRELTHLEAAAYLDQPLGTLKTRIRSGLSKLRATLGEGEQAP